MTRLHSRPGLDSCGRWLRSWLKKLQLAKAVLLGQLPQGLPDEDTLSNVYIYLQARSCPPPHKRRGQRSRPGTLAGCRGTGFGASEQQGQQACTMSLCRALQSCHNTGTAHHRGCDLS